jgi:hypothetical protein
MTLAGLIGISIVGAFVVGTLVFAVLRLLLVNWCPACSGRGYKTEEGTVRRCSACAGTGVLRVPDAPPDAWDQDRESEVA